MNNSSIKYKISPHVETLLEILGLSTNYFHWCLKLWLPLSFNSIMDYVAYPHLSMRCDPHINMQIDRNSGPFFCKVGVSKVFVHIV